MPAHDPALELAVLRAQGGEQDGFRELVRLCHGALRRHAARFLTDEGLASDAVQDAWCSIVRQLGRLDDPARFLPWALCIVARRAVDVARRRGRDKATASTVSLEGLAAEQTPALAADERERLRAAVQSLAFDHRIVVELHYEEGLSLPAVAEALGIALGTVKSRAFYARQQLRTVLEQSPHSSTRPSAASDTPHRTNHKE
ncbi:MAG: RNA polymerase sigma factor [Planctomycetes bacterium]|nr:RNA polymerase sigma factor [Planctomycetota bacterium]